jgi:hypothetical protein
MSTGPAPTPARISARFKIADMVALARDLAIKMYDEDTILAKHGLTAQELEILQGHEEFRALTERLALDWNSPRSVQERLALQTSVGLEAVLPDVIARATAKNEPLTGVAQLVKVLADICGANNKAVAAESREKFSINITIGGEKESFEKTRSTINIEPEPGPTDAVVERVGINALLDLKPAPE